MAQTQTGGMREGWAVGLLSGLLLAGAILCVGTLSANALRRSGGEFVVRQVFLAAETGAQDAKQLPREQTFDLFQEYVLAFADAVIRFDAVPKFDTRIVYSVAAALSEEMQVTSMAFSGYDIVIGGAAPDLESVEAFLARLRADGRFTGAMMNAFSRAEDGTRIFSVICTPKMEEGQLALGAHSKEIN